MTCKEARSPEQGYIHGTDTEEQNRLARFNAITNQAFIDFLDLTGARTVLEVGSGLGILTNMVGERLTEGTVIGVEYSSEQLASARALHPNGRFQQGDAHDLPYPDNSFDVVYCRWLLEHVRDPVQVLSQMKRVLKSSGKVYVVENDVTLNRLSPPTPMFDQIWSVEIPSLQAQLGGDAKIGSRLYALLVAAGFVNIELSIQPEVHWFASEGFRPWVQNLAAIVRGAAANLTKKGVSPDRIKWALEELQSFLELPNASAVFHFGRASGMKQDSEHG